MIKRTVKCPTCKHLVTITGDLEEKKILVCEKCGSKGVFFFPKTEHESIGYKSENAIEVKNLKKQYNKVTAVNNVSFSVKRGETFGFLGPNGAGKTTTIKAMLGLIHVNAGEITINNIDIHRRGKEAKKFVGYLPEKVAFYTNLTALQNLYFYAEMIHASKKECKMFIDEFGLGEAATKRVGAFSKGMIQRLGVARTLLGSPPVLILDEPTEGLDARGVVLIREKIKELKQQGTTIFISSHILSEIQAVCDRVGIINKGVLVAQDTVSELSKKLNLKPKMILELEKVSDTVVESLKKLPGIVDIKVIGCMVHIICDSKMNVPVILAVVNAGGNILNLQTQMPSLEEVFLRYTGG